VLRAVVSRRPKRVVELGAGVSTLVIAAALRANGAGRSDLGRCRGGLRGHHARATAAPRVGSSGREIRFAALKDMSFEGVTRAVV
jgi:hypothetical protein